MEFQVLGTVDVFGAGQRIDAGHPKQRAVLAVLVLDLNQVVPAERLIARIWGEDPPSSVRNVVYGYVARLRSALAAAADPAVSLSRRAGGYVLEGGDDQVDLFRFRSLVAQASVSGDDEQAALLLRESLDLWHGEALAGLSGLWFAAMRASLARQKMAALLDLNDIRLRQGQHHALASELAGQAAAHPADERLAGQLMRALYVSGRQAEALRWFEQTRQRLADELGADPGPELQTLHQQILRVDTSLAVPDAATARPVPRQLPPEVSAFTGRDAELAELDKLLASPETGHASSNGSNAPARAVVISAVSGTAGVGKTATALRWAHRAARLFPDGQLYVNLRGYDPGEPLNPADALAGFLRGLGVPAPDIPAEADEKAARYRSLLAGRRVLVVLDNARESDQVRPLLPGSPGCAVLVTSRDCLAGLIARDGARRLDLDLLPLPDAVGLLHALIGARVGAEPQAAEALAAQCCRLPLALRVAAELAAGRPHASLAELAGELADQQQRLDLLDAAGDSRAAARAVFSWSFRHLNQPAATAFQLAALHPGTDFDTEAFAVLTGSSYQHADRMLQQLARAHLIQPAGPFRHGMHNLLRAYGRELATAGTDQTGQRAALTRLLDHYQHTAATAIGILFPAHAPAPPPSPPPARPAAPLADTASARAWLDAERANLVAAASNAADHGWPDHAIRLAATLYYHLDLGGHYPEALSVHASACRAARSVGDRAAEAEALRNAGVIEVRQGRHQQATEHFDQALTLFRATADRTGQARTLGSLANLAWDSGQYQQASQAHREVLDLFHQAGNVAGQAAAHVNLGLAHLRQGRYAQAAGHFQQALALSQQTGNRNCEAYALRSLGEAEVAQDRYPQATDHLNQALALFRETADRKGEADTLHDFGDVDQRQGRYRRAKEHHTMALSICREMGYSQGQAEALNGLGRAMLAMGQPEDALLHHHEARVLADQGADAYQKARAHQGLGHAYAAIADHSQAREQWRHALAIYTRLGTPEADQIRAQLRIRG